MPLDRPYHRIWRPFTGFINDIDSLFDEGMDRRHCADNLQYLNSALYADQAELHSLITAARMIVQDIHQLFYYIEPCDANLSVFSHRIYELLLRVATEFETNCKAILIANYYSHTGHLNITDYYKINQATHLADYSVVFHRWQDKREWKPFDEWHIGHHLTWYQAYNSVKHNRQQKFSDANLENLMNAVAGLICILHAQVGDGVGGTDINGICTISNSQFEVDTNTFHLEVPEFPEDEQYSFVWSELEKSIDAVSDYSFS